MADDKHLLELRRLFEIERSALTRIGGGEHIDDVLAGVAAQAGELLAAECIIWLRIEDQPTIYRVGGSGSELTLSEEVLAKLERSKTGEELHLGGVSLGRGRLFPIVGLTGQFLGIWQVLSDNGRSLRDVSIFAAHIAAVAIERATSDRILLTRERELTRVQQLGRIGGVEVDLRSGFRNRRSPEYLTIHGLPPSAANETHEAWVARIHPEDRERTERQFTDAVAAGISDYQSEYRIIRPSDGELRWISVKAFIERTPDGKPIRLVGAHLDVTEEMLARETLRESEERFRLIANSAPVPIWVSKLNGHRAFANQAYLDFLGLDYESALTFDWRKILHPDDLPRILKEQVAGESSRLPFTLEARYRRADGEWRWIRSESQPRWDARGQHVGFIGVAYDITDTKEALKQSQEQFRLLVQSVVDYAICTLSLDGIVTSWNAGAERIKGYKPAEIIGQHFSSFYTDEDRKAGEPGVALGTARAEGRWEKEGLRIRKDGSRFWANVVIDAIKDDEGKTIGFAKITRDISERKEVEHSLEQARLELFQAQKMDAIGQLTGGVAHDFNNLLMAVLGSLELAKKRLPPDSSALRFIDNASEAAQRGAVLTQRMLSFARRQDLKPVAVDVGRLLNGMHGLMQSSLGPSIKIEVHIPSDLVFVYADPNQLELALLNLAVNGRDAMPNGGVLLFEAREEELSGLRPGRYVRLSIRDSGSGMDEETLARALEPFFTTKGVGKGTGLGLSMVHGMIEQLGGRMALESKIGEGTKVHLWLAIAHHVGQAKRSADEEVPRSLRKLTVLAVDDDPLVLFNTAAILEELGHNVIQAESGSKALELFRADMGIDLVITDQAMPSMTGLELARRIRSIAPDLPIVIATGYAELPAGTEERLPILPKPFRSQELSDLIQSLAAAHHLRMTT